MSRLRRRNFGKHLKIIEPLKEYWRFLDRRTDVTVKFIHNKEMESTKKSDTIKNSTSKMWLINRMKVSDQVVVWISIRSNSFHRV